MLGKFFSLGRREIAPKYKFCDTDCTNPLTENSHLTSIWTNLNFTEPILFFLKELCITFYLKGKLLVISLQICSWAMLGITKVQNKLMSVLQFQIVSFPPLRCIMPGILMTPINEPAFAQCVLVFVQKHKNVKMCHLKEFCRSINHVHLL